MTIGSKGAHSRHLADTTGAQAPSHKLALSSFGRNSLEEGKRETVDPSQAQGQSWRIAMTAPLILICQCVSFARENGRFLKKAPQKLFSHGFLRTLRHFVTENLRGDFLLAQAHILTKRARSLFRNGCLCGAFSRAMREKNKMTRKTKAMEVFAQPFSKGWRGVGRSPTSFPPTNYNLLKQKVRTRPFCYSFMMTVTFFSSFLKKLMVDWVPFDFPSQIASARSA